MFARKGTFFQIFASIMQRVNTQEKCTKCEEMIIRKDMTLHRSICPEVNVLCEYHSYGCRCRMKRKKENEHSKGCSHLHLSLVKKRCDALQSDNNYLRNRLNQTERVCIANDQKIKILERDRDEIKAKLNMILRQMNPPRYESSESDNLFSVDGQNDENNEEEEDDDTDLNQDEDDSDLSGNGGGVIVLDQDEYDDENDSNEFEEESEEEMSDEDDTEGEEEEVDDEADYHF